MSHWRYRPHAGIHKGWLRFSLLLLALAIGLLISEYVNRPRYETVFTTKGKK